MALFDSIVTEAQEKFGIGDEANKLLSVLLSMISDENNGGFRGFLGSFQETGLGDLASSWINSSANMAISDEQTESVFSEQTLKEMSEETGIDYKTTTSATAFMIPHIIDELTPNGEIPNERGLRTMIGGSLPELPATKSETPPGQTAAGEENSLLNVIFPLIIVGVLVAVSVMLFS